MANNDVDDDDALSLGQMVDVFNNYLNVYAYTHIYEQPWNEFHCNQIKCTNAKQSDCSHGTIYENRQSAQYAVYTHRVSPKDECVCFSEFCTVCVCECECEYECDMLENLIAENQYFSLFMTVPNWNAMFI